MLAQLLLAASLASTMLGQTVDRWGPIGQLSEALETPVLGDLVPPGEVATYSIGNLELDLSTGETFEVLVNERPVGLFFTGRGNFIYTSTDARAAESFIHNVRKATDFELVEGRIAGKVETALILDSRLVRSGVLDSTEEPTSERVGTTVSKSRILLFKIFDGHLDRFADDRLIIVENRLAEALVGGGDVVTVQMQTNKEDLLYVYDGVREHQETLAAMHRYSERSPLRGRRYAAPLVSRPLSSDWLHRPMPRFVLRQVDLDLVNREGTAMELRIEETFEIKSRVQVLDLGLWSEVIRPRSSYEYRLDSVEFPDGTPLEFSHRDDDLIVQLPEVSEAGDRVVVVFTVSGEVFRRPGGHNYWWLPIGAWLPLPTRIDAASYTVHARVQVADPFIPFGMGRTIRRWEEDGLAGLEFELSDPVQFAVALAGRYHSYSETRDDQTVAVSSYAFAQDEPLRQIAENAFEVIGFYESILGEFPFPELNILEINDFGFGVGPPGVIYLTREGFDPGPSGRSFRKEPNKRFAHEIGHMWWGHVVQMSNYDDQWLSESIAEYLAAVALEAVVDRGNLKDALREWRAEAEDTKSLSSIYMANRLVGERAAFHRQNLLYSKGPLLFHALREELGDDTFFELIRRFATDTRFAHIGTAGFIELTAEVSGTDYSEWFDRELFGLD